MLLGRDFGLKGDGKTDDSLPMQRALDEAAARGAELRLAPGRYLLSRRIRLWGDGMALMGAGREKTVLVFTQPLPRWVDAVGASPYAWSEGLVHIGPKEDFAPGGTLLPEEKNDWRQGERLALARPAERGEARIEVDSPAPFRAGQWIFLSWDLTHDRSVLKRISGGADFPPGSHWLRRRSLAWPVEIRSVEGKHLILRQPLRMEIAAGDKVYVRRLGRFISGVRVAELGIEMDSGAPSAHLREKGFNGIFLHRVVHAEVRNVDIRGADNGVLLNAVKNGTLSGVRIVGGRPVHHAFFTKHSHDNLIEDFVIESLVVHGINADVFGSGNVWRKGRMEHGTFDFHRGLQFDLIRTDIDVNNDGKVGGDAEAGPHQGVRVVHWNIRVRGKAGDIASPGRMPSGALVGIRGVPGPAPRPEAGCAVESWGEVPSPPDLYEAQRALGPGR